MISAAFYKLLIMNDLESESFDTLSRLLAGRVRSDHEIKILKYLFEKYNCRTVTEEANGNNRQTVYNKIKSGKIASIEMNNKCFIIF